MGEGYEGQVRLLLDVLPFVAAQPGLALKGGTAINLFVRDMPRLSVDIDLTWLRFEPRREALAGIGEALGALRASLEGGLPGTKAIVPRLGGGLEVKLLVERRRVQVKIEVNATLRGHLRPVRRLPCAPQVQERFEAFVEAVVVSHGELYGGKLCAALDRQHPRDLFDVRGLLDHEGLSPEVADGLVVGLVSHNRPVAELIGARLQDRAALFDAEFAGMTLEPFDYTAHCATFARLQSEIRRALTPTHRAFLLGFEAGDPDWTVAPDPEMERLPAVQWKLLNVRRLREQQPDKHRQSVEKLERALIAG